MSGRSLMVQGTTSDAGKSTLVTGLCRVLMRRGVRVAPFKPQNMALNSAVTSDGGEIGRAQALQAQAAGIVPTTDMNPVLLKPNTDVGAQVIVHGRAIGNMEAAQYHRYKAIAREAVLASHSRLAASYDAIIVEGAGSPAEINLRDGDIANMGFAEAVDCPVVLVADIDRGGVFAHLTGTVSLLSPSEQNRIAGFVINRFRGELSLLESGLQWLERHTGKRVFGVLPYLHGLHLDAEDAISREAVMPAQARAGAGGAGTTSAGAGAAGTAGAGQAGAGAAGAGHAAGGGTAGDRATRTLHDRRLFRVVVPVLPRISNHTDFDPLRQQPDLELCYTGPGQPPPPADLVILPGSKSVRADLAWLRTQGWTDYLQRHLRYGGKLIGICGGLQMLGRRIGDPLGLEGAAGASAGFGFLDMDTVLEPEKQLRNVTGHLVLEQAPLRGYEIHAGVSQVPALGRPAAWLDGGRPDGAISGDEQVLGTYVHGLFESPEACAALLRWAGLREPQLVDHAAVRERAIDRIADAVEAHLDIDAVLRLLDHGLPGLDPEPGAEAAEGVMLLRAS